MLKYLQKVKDRLTGLKAGITNNSAAWVGQPDTPATVQAEIKTLDSTTLKMYYTDSNTPTETSVQVFKRVN